MTTKELKQFPPYIRLGGPKGTAMRLVGPDHYNGIGYWRDGGQWGVNIKKLNEKFISKSYIPELDELEFFPITKKEWAKDNGGYVDKDTKAYKF